MLKHDGRGRPKASYRRINTRINAELLVGDGKHRHVTAESLFESARDQGAPVSLATVYNTLRAFCQAGILQEITVDGSRIGIEQQFVRVPAFAMLGIPRSMHSEAVVHSWSNPRDSSVEDVMHAVWQFDAVLDGRCVVVAGGFFEDAQFDTLSALGPQCRVDFVIRNHVHA